MFAASGVRDTSPRVSKILLLLSVHFRHEVLEIHRHIDAKRIEGRPVHEAGWKVVFWDHTELHEG